MADDQRETTKAGESTADPGTGDARPVRGSTQIGRLAVPMVMGEIVGYLTMLILVAMVGRMGGQALYVRSLFLPLGMVFSAVNAALAVSAQVACSLSKGRETPEDVFPITVSMVKVWVILGVALTAVLSLGASGFADLFNVPGSARQDFVWFLRWMSVVSLLGFGPALCASALRGFGFARQALVLTLVSSAIEIVLVAWLGLGTGLGMHSLPIAAAACAAAGTLAGLWLLRRAGLWQQGQRAPWRRDVLGHIKSVGLPVGATLAIISLYSLALIWVLGPFGEATVAGFATASAVQTLIIMPALVLGSATGIIVNQQRGAGSYERLVPTYRSGIALSFAVFAVIAVVTFFGRDAIAHVMIGDAEADAAVAASRYLAIVGLTYAVEGPVLVALTLLEHIGGGRRAVVLNLVYFGGNVVAGSWACAVLDTPDGLYWTVAISNLVSAIALAAAAGFVRKLVADHKSTQAAAC
ncbi:MATE family efflux transporter [Streptomyces sp. NBC_01210]|uniref:MATE family efflux transporter n=1 Tax=Streptomyces sp. NBC_01210 TaxID=2903774 RepID=UPI002E1526F7|nr:MATE family efflux transporter [Streptomyces sp. NBC_01210]